MTASENVEGLPALNSVAPSQPESNSSYSPAMDDERANGPTSNMQVPNRIRVAASSGSANVAPSITAAGSSVPLGLSMTVPERILVLEGGQHASGGASVAPRELLMEQRQQHQRLLLHSEFTGADIYTPDILRVEQLASPILVSPEHKSPRTAPSTPPARQISELEDMNVSRHNTTRDLSLCADTSGIIAGTQLTEDTRVLHRQMLKLNRRLMLLEMESQRRKSREVLLYSIGLAYAAMRLALWVGRTLS